MLQRSSGKVCGNCVSFDRVLLVPNTRFTSCLSAWFRYLSIKVQQSDDAGVLIQSLPRSPGCHWFLMVLYASCACLGCKLLHSIGSTGIMYALTERSKYQQPSLFLLQTAPPPEQREATQQQAAEQRDPTPSPSSSAAAAATAIQHGTVQQGTPADQSPGRGE
eukprot:scaffold97385_cov18-Tisochrysis_lutea.AAC.1